MSERGGGRLVREGEREGGGRENIPDSGGKERAMELKKLNGGPCGWISDSRVGRSGRRYEAISRGFTIFMQGAVGRR